MNQTGKSAFVSRNRSGMINDDAKERPTAQHSKNGLWAAVRSMVVLVAVLFASVPANSIVHANSPDTYPLADRYYQVTAQHSGMCLDVAYASMAHAANVVQGTCWGGTNQQWYLRFAGIPEGPIAYYELVARHSGKCLDVAYASMVHGANVVQGTCWGGQNQQWYLRPSATPGYYEVVARHSNMCLDVAYASLAHAANVIQGSCWGGRNQQWWFAAI